MLTLFLVFSDVLFDFPPLVKPMQHTLCRKGILVQGRHR